jgi:flagellar basal-body rod modification protein FlgD
MTTIGPISGSNSLTSGTNASNANTTPSNARMGVDDLMRVLMTQLTFQDPLKPMDNQQFMAQMAQFTTLEQTNQLNARMDALLSTQASLQSVGLLGKSVTFNDAAGNSQTGVVTQLSLAGDSPVISVRLSAGVTIDNVTLNQIQTIK